MDEDSANGFMVLSTMSSPRPTSKRQRVKNFFKSNLLVGSSRTRPHESASSDSSQQSHLSENLKISGRFAVLILPKLAECVDGNPAKMAFKILNVIMDVRKEINDNKDELQRVLEETLMLLSTVLATMETGSNTQSVIDQTVAQYKREITQELERITTLNDRLTSSLVSQFDYESYKEQLGDISRKIGGSTNRFNTGMAGNTGIMVDELRDEKREEKLRKDLNPSKIADHRFIHDGKSMLMRKTCTEGTRVKILKEITEWANDSAEGSPSVFWLTGQAGAGKTTIAYTIAKRFGNGQPTTLGASFFCSRQFAETRSLRRIIPTIAFQLARHCEPYRIALFGVDTDDAVDSHNVDEQVQKFLFKPWMARARRHKLPTYLMVVDALDEIEDVNRSSVLKELLESVEKDNINGLKFLITSRPDRNITTLCQSFPPGAVCQLQNVPAEQAKQDIKTYLNSELKDLKGKPELDELNEKAAGLFIYAATVVKILTKSELDVDEQLLLLRRLLSSTSSSLSSIDQLYQQIMSDAFADLDEDLLVNRIHILYTFLCSAERTSALVAANLVDTKVGIAAKVIDSLHAVLYVEGGQVYWYHASFPDFIFNRARSKFRMDNREFDFSCDPAAQHSLLVHACFRIMYSKEIGLRFNMGDIKSSYLLDSEHIEELRENVNNNISPALRYACMYWAYHVSLSTPSKDSPVCDIITDFLQLRVLFWIEAMHLIGSSGECSHLLHTARNWVSKKGNLTLAKDLQAAADFVSYHTNRPAAGSTPHLYISSLATWQSVSCLSQSWKEKFPHIPVYKHTTGGLVAMPIMVKQLVKSVKVIAFSPDGKHVVAGLRGSVVVLDAFTCREEHILCFEDSGYVKQVKFSPDGTRFVVVYVVYTGNCIVHIWDASTFQLLHKFKVHKSAVAIEGTEILSVSEVASDGSCQFQFLDVSAGSLLRTRQITMTESVQSMAFSSVSMRCMLVFEECVEIWDMSPECAAKKVTLQDCIVYHYGTEHAVMSCGGKLAAIVTSLYGYNAGVFDAATGSRLHVLPHDETVQALDFSYDETYIASVSYNGILYIWDTATGEKLKVLKPNSPNFRTSSLAVAFTREGSHIGLSLEDTIQVWSLDDLTLTEAECDIQDEGLSNDILLGLEYVGTVSANSKKIISFNSTKVQVWDATTGTALVAMSGHLRISEARISSNGENIACCLANGSVKVLDATNHGDEIFHLESEINTSVQTIAISKSGKKFALGRHTDWGEVRIEIWGLDTGKEAVFFLGKANYGSSLDFMDDERYILAAFRGSPTLVICDLQTGNTQNIESKMNQNYQSLSASQNEFVVYEYRVQPEGDSILYELWNISSGIYQNTHKLSFEPWNHNREEEVWINSFCFSSKDKKFVAACGDGYIRVWSATSNKTVVNAMLVYCPINICSIALFQDNKMAVTGSGDGSVQVWDLDNDPDIAEKYPWEVTESGWITSSQNTNYRLMWVSDRLKIRQPRNTSFISGPGYGSVDFSRAMLGEDWEECYAPQNHIGESS